MTGLPRAVAEREARERGTGFAVWVGFAAMGLGMFMAILDIQVVVTSLPTIQRALDIAPDEMSWVQTAYLIAEVIAIPLTGLLTRMLSMRGLFVAAVLVFTLASIGCAASIGFGLLVAWRVLQGFAGGVLIPLVFSAVFLLFAPRQQAIATTIAGALAVLAPTVGPLVGGWITQTFSWHWLFLINVAPGMVAAVAAMPCLPAEASEPRLAARLDWPSLLVMAIALAALEIALKEAPKRGWSSAFVLGFFGLCIAGTVLFARRTLAARLPVVHLAALADRDFAVGCWLSFVLGAGLYGSVYLMPVFLAFVRGHGPLEIGEIMLVTGAVQLITSPIAVQLERRADARLLTASGFALFALGLGLSAFETRLTDFDGMLLPQVVRGGAIMLCLLPPTRLALGHFPPERVTDASGLFNLMRNLGGAIAIAVIDTIVYGRAPSHVDQLVDGLMRGDIAVARTIGLPETLAAGIPASLIDPGAQAMIKPLVEKAGLVMAINEAWASLGLFTLLGLLVVPFVSGRRPRWLSGSPDIFETPSRSPRRIRPERYGPKAGPWRHRSSRE
ncbi:MAG: DHA2 family efflux MFS transporter permease subunit [Methylobacteriaceae bacterium]|nr:DHA2 family efflux MFS transporter permease subunit [Methylobacteriaceae bacterium]